MDKRKYYKDKYVIVFYDETDNFIVGMFDNIKQICEYKKMDITLKSYNLVKIELYRSLNKQNGSTRMLNGKKMYIHLMDKNFMDNDDQEDEI